ncbi:thiamine pyrophosphate-binding protein [Nitratireductor aquimarinus]|uniref:thiamine pyrophosphate-binding protein n=1 Tax=Nitratireductor aquimarinus TaxID=889300 RepID=UPI001A8F9903|nr:thiamine pyrophosphate-binding protein [Nitratireductor aquimarinus]MBN8245661.1 thiamine pyrophosphate-binding protein [Nitratireductor aquimarinus]MBY6134044.1 thiamine pyrophosphate-binding protein [Nitratireductor aquimarinus]MCA1305140.1 thiamine pyrophosphate-binding protein [Nitratireductor aquimarinus]
MKRVLELLAESLDAHDVKDLFGLIGDANLYMVDAWVRRGNGRYTACAHEASAVLAALGYAQVTGRTGVATITHGPALTNAMTAIAEGVKGGVAMVLLCGDTAAHAREHLQKIDQRELVKAAGAGFVDMRTPDTASADLARAFRQAALERRPVVFNMRADLQWQQTDAAPVVFSVPTVRTAVVDSEDLDEALGMIASAKRPFILAGRGAIVPGAKEAIVRLARRLEAPLATSLKAAGLFTGEAFNLGVLGTVGREVVIDAVTKSDCVVAFGASLNFMTTDNGALLLGKRVVQVLADPAESDRRPDRGVLLISDLAAMAERMIETLDLAEIPPSGNADEAMAEALRHEAVKYASPIPFATTAPGTIDYVPALRRIEKTLPADRILVSDVGRFTFGAWRNLSVSDPHYFVYSSNFASIGLGLGEAIGAARAEPEALTVLLSGDGGFMMGGLTEMATVAREGLNIAILIFNDGSYGAEHIQFTSKNMSPALSMISPPDFVKVAKAMGFRACRVTSPDELDTAINLLAEGQGPCLVDLHLDPYLVRQD